MKTHNNIIAEVMLRHLSGQVAAKRLQSPIAAVIEEGDELLDRIKSYDL